jgi:xylulose-5-phosphate/fructose-6-phosphate phosphoketolase
VTQVASMAGDTSADNEAGGQARRWHPTLVLRNAEGPLERDDLVAIDAWWRAANYLAVGQIYLSANPLLREPLQPKHIKLRPLGHFGTVPGLN